jgi:hypothetical protein
LEIPLIRRPLLLIFTAVAAACASYAKPGTPAAEGRAPNRFIYVTAQDIPGECYRDLGRVHYEEPFTDAAIDPDDAVSSQRLRAEALKTYPGDADAVINVHREQNDAGTLVTVVGQAVELQNHETIACAARKMPSVIDKSAALAAGGISGAALEGSLSGSTQGAETGAAIGAAGVGKYQLSDQQREAAAQQAAIRNQLDEQRRQIDQLLAERSRLQECQQQEVALADCAPAEPAAQPVKNGATTWSGSTFELEKQIQEQQNYIGQLKDQLDDMRRQMAGY